MDGIHDMGGMQGFGKVEVEAGEPVFHSDWEARVFALVELCFAAGLIPNTDAFRHAIERMDPVAYLGGGYYGRWLSMVETLLHETGQLRREEIDGLLARRGVTAPGVRVLPGVPPLTGTAVPPGADGARRAVPRPAAFRAGDGVVTRRFPSPGHTRLPRYARGRRGTIRKAYGGWVWPDSNAHGLGENPQHLYSVAFRGTELWGPHTEPSLTVHLDLFEDYLHGDD